MNALVTVVTSTWARHRTPFTHAIPSIRAQDYPDIEHLIVIDGRDPGMVKLLQDVGYSFEGRHSRIAFLGRNWSSFSGDGGAGATARMCGAWMATGDYVAYLDDDNDYLPGHISSMVEELEASGADLVTSSWFYHVVGGSISGGVPPGVGRTDTSGIMHRAELLTKGSWQLDGYEGDGRMVERWIAAGCTWRHKYSPTFVLNPYRHGAPD